jgi:capsular polysaccharide transport system permease protein
MMGVFDDLLIIRALMLRNMRNKYRDNPLGLMLEFLKPVIVCSVHYWYFSLAGRNVPDNKYLIFTIGGFSVWFCFIASYMGTLQRGMGAQGVTNVPGVTEMHLCLARSIWSFLLFVVFVYAFAFPGMWMGAPISPPNLLITLSCYGMAAGLGFAFGLVTNAIEDVVPALGPFLKMFQWALFITSGIYDSLSTISRLFLPYVVYNPLIHLAEYERHAFDPGYPVFFAHLAYPAYALVGLLFVGLAANRALARRGRGMNAYYA